MAEGKYTKLSAIAAVIASIIAVGAWLFPDIRSPIEEEVKGNPIQTNGNSNRKHTNNKWAVLYNRRTGLIDNYIHEKIEELIKDNYFSVSVRDKYKAGLHSQLKRNNGKAILIDTNGTRFVKIIFTYKTSGDLKSVETTNFDKSFFDMLKKYGISMESLKHLINQFNIEGYGAALLDEGVITLKYDYGLDKWAMQKTQSY